MKKIILTSLFLMGFTSSGQYIAEGSIELSLTLMSNQELTINTVYIGQGDMMVALVLHKTGTPDAGIRKSTYMVPVPTEDLQYYAMGGELYERRNENEEYRPVNNDRVMYAEVF